MNSRLLRAGWIMAVIALSAPLAATGSDDFAKAKEIEGDLVKLVKRLSKAYVMIGGGSGVVISPDGWMLTNDHVIDQQRKKKVWNVMMPVRKRYVADLLGKDQTGDIALLKIRNVTDLPYVPLGDSDAVIAGQMVVALGNPFSHAFRTAEPTVTVGIVSAIHRNQGTYSDAIQTDAPLNPGNSGGPLIDLKGRLIGINGRVRVRFFKKFNTGVGLAIPTNQIARFIPLLKKGDVAHGHITGLSFRTPTVEDPTLVVSEVRSGTAAERSGFAEGDRIVTVGGLPAWNLNRFWGIIHAYPEGATVPVTVERDGKTVRLEAQLKRWVIGRPAVQLDDTKPGLGVTVKDEAPVTGGAEVDMVLPGSAASKAGLKSGDIILQFDGKQVLDPADLNRLIKSFYKELNQKRQSNRRYNLSRETTLKYQRGIEEKTLKIQMGPEPE